MKTLDQAVKDYVQPMVDEGMPELDIVFSSADFKNGVEFAQKWISVEDEFPQTIHEFDDKSGVFYSDYVLIKVKGYEHPFVGYYVESKYCRCFDFIHASIDKEINRNDIIEWRPIEIK